MRKALNLRPSPPDDTGSDVPGKYVSGLKQFRVHNASEAKALVKMGQLHRRVFGTLANRESSRSHGIVTLKIIRGHRGERNDPTALQVSRLTLVDLAGSERTKHTQTTGDRLKEAGNINKSLMVLGQCMEVMRSNQRRLAVSLAHEGVGLEGRMDTRDVKKGLAIVPFRHSKLTELLMDYFTGNGRVVMIVNVNPYDTGYDENSHVMKFAALAREVYVTPAPAPMQRAPLASSKVSDAPRPSQTTRKVTIDNGGPGRKSAVLTVLEEEEPDEGYSNDSELANPLVDALFDEIESLHVQLFECELKCAVIEAETREEVMKEMEERMRQMEKMYARRLMNEVERNEMKTDAKIEFLHQSGLFNSPTKRPQPVLEESEDEISHIIEELDVEMDLVASGEELVEEGSSVSGHSRSPSPSIRPKAKHSSNVPPVQTRQSMGRTEVVHHVPQGPAAVKLPSDEEELSETEDDDTEADDIEDESDDSGGEEEIESDDDDWQPDAPPKGQKATRKSTSSSTSRPQAQGPTKGKKAVRISDIDEELECLSIKDDDEDDDDDATDDEEVKKPKPKRILGKKPIVTEDQIEKVVGRVQLQASRSSGVRRSTRG
ncbi:hypothetical protein ONZ45_g5728 [Pleurotus djamor]|nr:hypothetical protein ONZ45_g5728 [Pleurotus djamor]